VRRVRVIKKRVFWGEKERKSTRSQERDGKPAKKHGEAQRWCREKKQSATTTLSSPEQGSLLKATITCKARSSGNNRLAVLSTGEIQ
jgi:hypothetical protein